MTESSAYKRDQLREIITSYSEEGMRGHYVNSFFFKAPHDT